MNKLNAAAPAEGCVLFNESVSQQEPEHNLNLWSGRTTPTETETVTWSKI